MKPLSVAGPAAAVTAGSGNNTGDAAETSATSPPTQRRSRKWQRVLRAFLDRGELGWNRFEAYREFRDSVLNTSVSQLERRGVRILRAEEAVPGHFGVVRCYRYRLAPESRARALELLSGAK